MPFGDALGAEGDRCVDTGRLEPALDALGGAREHSRPKDHEGTRLDVGDQLVDDSVEHRHRRVHELVDRGSNHEDHRLGPLDHRRLGAELEPARGQKPGQQLSGAVLTKRQLACFDALDLGHVDVVDADPIA